MAALLAKWADETIQAQLLGAVRNVVPYWAIADVLCRQGTSGITSSAVRKSRH